jgi:hypothetical protein
MDDAGSDTYHFLCPKCDESLEVNDSMKDTLIERGCVVCGAAVTAESFSKHSPPDSA